MKSLQLKLLFIFLVCLFGNQNLFSKKLEDVQFGKILKEIRISGARVTDRDIITRELASRVGEPYTKKSAEKDFARLDNLDIFSKLEIHPVEEQDGIVLNIDVREITPYLPFFTWEVTDENGFAGGPGLQSVNFLGRDVFVTGLARFGGATNFGLFIQDPWIAGNHLSYTLEVNQRDRANDLDDINEISTEIDLRISSYLGEHGRIGGGFSFLSIKSDSAGLLLADDNRDNLPTFSFFMGYDNRDLWSNPHRGGWNEIELSKGGGFLGADNDYWALNVDIRRYIPLIDRHTLALFSLLTLRTGDVGDEISPVEDFHIGGTNSVRGWEVGSRGGGKNQFVSTAEYRVTVVKPRLLNLFVLSLDVGLELAAFGDLGIVWNDNDQFDTDNFIGGYGFGLRFLVPFVNQFRIDFAFGEPGESIRLHLGAFTKPVAQRFRIR